MRKIPDGWNDQYTMRYLYDRVTSLNGSAPVEDQELRQSVLQLMQTVNHLQQDANQKTQRIADLEAEIARLDTTKADRAGRPRKQTSTA